MVDSDHEPDDLTLMQRIASGDDAALAILFDRYGRLVYSLSMRILDDRQHAEDVLVEVFWELWERAPQYRPERGAPLTFLTLLARSRAIDRRRRVGRRAASNALLDATQADGGIDPESATPGSSAMQSEQQRLVLEALDELDEGQQQVLQLSFFEGLSHSQISMQLDMPIGTVKSRIRSGLFRLRDKLNKFFLPSNES